MQSKKQRENRLEKQNLIRRAFGNYGTTTKDPKFIPLEIRRKIEKELDERALFVIAEN